MLLTDDKDLHRAEPKDAALPAAAHRHPDHPRPAKVFRRLAEHWPWTLALTSAFLRLRLIPLAA